MSAVHGRHHPGSAGHGRGRRRTHRCAATQGRPRTRACHGEQHGPQARHTRLLGEDFAQHSLHWVAISSADENRFAGVRGAPEPVERFTPLKQRHVVGFGQRLGVPVVAINGQFGQRPTDGRCRSRASDRCERSRCRNLGAVDVSEAPIPTPRPGRSARYCPR